MRSNRLMNIIWPTGFISIMISMGCAMNALAKTGGDTPKADNISATERGAWFEEARFGMFIHWGLYSELAGCWDGKWLPQPGHGKSWYAEWIQMRLDVPDKEYQALVKSFNPVKFNADAWVSEAAGAGMRYLVLTAKHHDGFALWDSAVTDYDLGATPCKRDLLGELAEACRRHGVKLGFYYSHWQDWRHPGGAQPPWPDKKQPTDEEFETYWQTICLPQVTELIDRYDPDMFWFDTWGKNARKHITTLRRDQLIRLVRTKSPRCLINGRICAHNPGDNVDYLSAGDNQFPEKNLGRPWQTPATMQHSWAWHARDFNWKSSNKMIGLLVHNTSLGGNYLLNVGPLPDGRFPAPAVRRLREIGGWMAANHEAIYGTEPVALPRPAWGRLTQKKRKDGSPLLLYAYVFDWPKEQRLLIKNLSGNIANATVLETGQPLIVKTDKDGSQFIELPEHAPDDRVSVIVLEIK